MNDAAALDTICAILNTTDSGADAIDAITGIIVATGRPYVDQLPVVEAHTRADRHGLPTACIDVNGIEAVRLWITPGGDIRVRISRPAGSGLAFTVEHEKDNSRPAHR